MVSRFRLRRVTAAVVSIVALSACGSTVAARPDAGGAADGGLAVAPEDGSASQGGASALGGGSAPGVPGSGGSGGGAGSGASGSGFGGSGVGGSGSGSTSSGGSTGSGGTSSGSSGGSAGTGSRGGAVGPGITATKIYVGAPWNSDANATNAAIGVDNANSGDERQYWAAIVDDLNKRGGILGRKMEVIFAEFRAATNEPVEAQQQAACDKWTKDNKVFAIYGGGSDIMLECTRKAGVLATGGGTSTGPIYARNPQLIDPSAVRFERLAQISVDGLGALKYFKPEPEWPIGKVGLISWDNPDYRYAYDQGYLPALKRQGITLTDTAWIAEPATVDALGNAGAAISAAVLRFQEKQIDHVLIQDGQAGVFRGGGLTLSFLRTAESQTYRPRYGFNANNFPGNPNLPPEQQHGMLAIDYADTEPAQDEGIAPNQQRERCFKIVTARGLSVADEQKRATAAGFCEFTWFVETLLNGASTPTLPGVIRAAEGLGTSFASPAVYGTFLGPGRHDGVDLVRGARFDDVCDCMKFLTKPYRP